MSQLDPTKGDAFDATPPPNAGPYNARLVLGSRGVELGYREFEQGQTGDHGKAGTEFYRVNIECRIVAPGTDSDNFPFFQTATTRLGRGKGMSTAAQMLERLGQQIPNQATDRDIAVQLANVIKTEPILPVWCDWEAYSKTENRTVYGTQVDFPLLANGQRDHEPWHRTRDQNREQLRAQLKPIRWFHMGETPQPPAGFVGFGQPGTVPQPAPGQVPPPQGGFPQPGMAPTVPGAVPLPPQPIQGPGVSFTPHGPVAPQAPQQAAPQPPQAPQAPAGGPQQWQASQGQSSTPQAAPAPPQPPQPPQTQPQQPQQATVPQAAPAPPQFAPAGQQAPAVAHPPGMGPQAQGDTQANPNPNPTGPPQV